MSLDARINMLIRVTEEKCLSWIGEDGDGNCVVIDPNDEEVIGAHYAMTHLAAALVIAHSPEELEFKTGVCLVRGVLNRWATDSVHPAFHNDFNNMGLCLVEERLSNLGIEKELCLSIRTVVGSTPDSNNPTTNWIPMRIYVNLRRMAWGSDSAAAVIAGLDTAIAKAWNNDGFIEDRLPKGTSFNLQYDVATVALLSFLNNEGMGYNIEKGVYALVNALGPDGDINYLGRGCNQSFAWGLWLYLLKSQGQKEAFLRSLNFFESRIDAMLQNDNLLLNDLPGASKDYWWDYHYASVYTSHLLLWLVLCRELPEKWVDNISLADSYGGESGVRILRSNTAFVATFSGRKEYLAEAGPVVAELWTKKFGVVVKGSFGPWLKKFGESYTSTGILLNHFGLIKLSQTFGCSMAPAFALRATRVLDESVVFEFSCKRGVHLMNVPLQNPGAKIAVSVRCDGKELPVKEVALVKSQYGYVTVVQSSPSRGKNWIVEVKL